MVDEFVCMYVCMCMYRRVTLVVCSRYVYGKRQFVIYVMYMRMLSN